MHFFHHPIAMKRFVADMLMPAPKKANLHEQFLCPITQTLMVNPVQASDGWTYERSAIATWCEAHNTSPLDPSVTLDLSQLKPNRSLRDAIERLVEDKEFDEAVCAEWSAAFARLESAPQLYRDGRLEEAAECGHPDAMGELAMRYHAGTNVLQDIPTALKWAHQAALAGNANGQFRMGYAFHAGEGRSRNYLEALKFYSMAFQNGVHSASSYICELYCTGGYGLVKNSSKMAEWCVRSNTARSLHMLAMCYYTGEGIVVNHAEARRNFKVAAVEVLESQYMLGKMLIRGEGGPANLVEGVKQIDRAAKQGLAAATALKDSILAAARI